jgi:diguanylate cyclase (GGDEF)-like protein/PAS domain S-box-containing protein
MSTDSMPQGPVSLSARDDRWFRQLTENSITAVFVMREKFLYANPAGERLLGYSVEELLGMEPTAVLHPEQRAEVGKRYGDRLKGEPVIRRYDMRLIRKDGTEIWVDYSATRTEYDGKPAVLAEAMDITEARAQEERLRKIVEGTSGVVGEPFFQRLVRGLVEVFQARAAFVAEAPTNGSEQMLVLDAWSRSDSAPKGRFPLEARQALAVGSVEGSLSSGLPPPFAESYLRALEATTFQLTFFADSGGRSSGFIGLVADSPFTISPSDRSILEFSAHRAAAELERLRTEEALAHEKEHAQVTLASIGDGVIRTDAQGRVDFINPVASWLLGWRSQEASDRPISEIYRTLDETTRRPLEEPVTACMRRRRLIVHPMPKILIRRGDGAEFAVRDSVAPIRDRQGQVVGAVLIFKDVTELRGMEREMRFMESHDALTGLLNRAEFERRLERALESSAERSHVLCFLDLDDFKLVNDSFGSTAGDELLKSAASLLRARVREGDATARLGSDEFGILFEDCPVDLARSLVESTQAGLKEQSFSWRERPFESTGSFGLVPVLSQFRAVPQLLSVAQGACYLAQQQGRNQLYEYRPGDTAVNERLDEIQWVHRIHQAFEDDRFVLYRQPIESLQEGLEPINEIFLRMIDEEGEIVPPGPLIQAAERYRLVSTIDRWVVARAFEVLVRSGSTLQGIFTINLSAQSLSEEGFLETIAALLEGSGVEASRICFEITETAAIANLDHALRFFREFKRRGCRFLLDDFGSGMSSLAYLKNLPVDFVKIDGEFIRNLGREPIQRAMVESIRRIGTLLGIATIGECVEGAATLEILRDIGIDYGQGYWLAEPRPLESPADVGGRGLSRASDRQPESLR